MTTVPDEESLALLQLNLTYGVGPRLQSQLLERFGSATRIFAATGSELLSVPGIGPKVSTEITRGRDYAAAREEWSESERRQVRFLFRGAENYPRLLREIPDPPPVLSLLGDWRAGDELAVGIVGSRQCTHYGTTQAFKLAEGLARAGVTVVSGLARGIDAAAHRGALAAGGRTLAVCAPGLAHLYPPEHRGLADDVIASGALISESPLQRAPQKGLFPQRNRIISGLSCGVIIVEAGRGSGALHTARHAQEQNREVFAVPGRIDSLASVGCHDLLRDGATLVRGVDDILQNLGPLPQPVVSASTHTVASPRELTLDEQERAILNLVDFAPTAVDHVLAQAGLEASRVLSTLTVLEMKRFVRRLPGSHVERLPG